MKEYTRTFTAEFTLVREGQDEWEEHIAAQTEQQLATHLRKILGADQVLVRDLKLFIRDLEDKTT